MGIAETIKREGGPTAFSRETGVPLRTSEDWKAGRRKPPAWLVPILNEWLKLRSTMKTCEWEYQGYNDWESGCGVGSINWNECEGPHENDSFKFCPYCGGKIVCKPMPCEQCANWLKEEKDCSYVNVINSPRCDDFKEVPNKRI